MPYLRYLLLLFLCVFCLSINTNLIAIEQAIDDTRQLILRKSQQSLGSLTYGDFLHCLSTAHFENENKRKISTKNKRLVIVEIEGEQWFIEKREEIESVIIESITVDTHHYTTLAEQSRLLMHLFSHCQIP